MHIFAEPVCDFHPDLQWAVCELEDVFACVCARGCVCVGVRLHAVAKRLWFQPKFWRFEAANCKLGSVGAKQIREYRERERETERVGGGREVEREGVGVTWLHQHA